MQLVSNQVIASLDYFRAPSRLVPVQRLVSNGYRLDPPAFLSEQQGRARDVDSRPLKEFADVFTVYIQSPLLAYVKESPISQPYLLLD